MSQYPSLCMVNYDREPQVREVPILKRCSRSPRRAGSAGPIPRHDRTETTVEYGYLSVREGIKVVTEDYATPHRVSFSPRTNQADSPRQHNSQLSQSLTSPRCDVPYRLHIEGAGHHKRSYSDGFRLPVLRCGGAGETSLTVNAEMLQDPRWNEYLSAWVSGKKNGYRAYLNIVRAMSLIDRGLIHYLPDFEDLPSLPCPRFWQHMHKEQLPQLQVEKKRARKKVTKKPEFWSWKERTTPKIPSLKTPVEKPAHCCRYCNALWRDVSTFESCKEDTLSTIEEETLSALARENLSSRGSKCSEEFGLPHREASLSKPGLIIINGKTYLSNDRPLLSGRKWNLSNKKLSLHLQNNKPNFTSAVVVPSNDPTTLPSSDYKLQGMSVSHTATVNDVGRVSPLSDDSEGSSQLLTRFPYIYIPTSKSTDVIAPPVEIVKEEPEPDKALLEIDEEPSDYGSIQSDSSTYIKQPFSPHLSHASWESDFTATEMQKSFVSASSTTISVPIKTPPNLFRLTTPPKTASPMMWEEHSFLSDSAIDSWADREPMSPLEPLDVDLNLFFTSEYIEVLEPVEWGCADVRDPVHDIRLKEIITHPGLEITVVPPLPLEDEPFKPDLIEDVDRVTIQTTIPERFRRPPIPKPTPPKEPTPPPKLPTPPPTPKRTRKPIIKKTRKQPVSKKPLTPVLEPEIPEPVSVRQPTPPPKAKTPVPPAPVKMPTPKPSPVPAPRRIVIPPPKEPTPEPPREPTPQLLVVEPSPEPETSPTPEPAEIESVTESSPTPALAKTPLPPPQKDLDFLADMERERLAEERQEKALNMFNKIRRRVSFPKVKLDEVVPIQEYGWLPQFCIIKDEYKRMYKATFDTVDENKDGYLNCFETLLALKGIIGLQKITEKEEEYVYRVLEIADYNIAFGTDFQLFAVVAALAQKIVSIDDWVKNIIKKFDLEMLDWKMFKAKELFKWCLDEDTNQLSVTKLMIELKAGGVSQEHQDEVMDKFGGQGTIDLLTFLTYLPLFIMTHKSVVDNPLDMSREK